MFQERKEQIPKEEGYIIGSIYSGKERIKFRKSKGDICGKYKKKFQKREGRFRKRGEVHAGIFDDSDGMA